MALLRWFFGLFIFSVLVSQSAMDAFSVLFCLQWVWLVWQSRKNNTPLRLMRPFGLEWIFVGWVIVAAIGFALNPMDFQYAVTRVVEFKWILILYVMIEIFHQVRPSVKNLNVLMAILLAIAGSNLFLYFADFPIFSEFRYGSSENGFLRAGGLFADPMTFAHSFALFFCVFLGLFLIDSGEWSKKQRGLAATVLVLSAVGLTLTFTRGVWIGLSVGVFGTLCFWRPRWGLPALVLATALAFGLYKTNDDVQWRVNNSLTEMRGASERKLLWQTHGQIFKDHFLFGAGYGQNTKMLPEYYQRLGIAETTLISHAHNQYLHLAAGTGLLGLLCYLLIWSYFFFLLWRLWGLSELSRWDRGLVLGFWMAQVTFCVGSLTEANFEHSKVRFAVMLIWAYTAYLATRYGIRWRIEKR